jgi:hypothetical protein
MIRAREYEGYKTSFATKNVSLNNYLFFLFADEIVTKIRSGELQLEGAKKKQYRL